MTRGGKSNSENDIILYVNEMTQINYNDKHRLSIINFDHDFHSQIEFIGFIRKKVKQEQRSDVKYLILSVGRIWMDCECKEFNKMIHELFPNLTVFILEAECLYFSNDKSGEVKYTFEDFPSSIKSFSLLSKIKISEKDLCKTNLEKLFVDSDIDIDLSVEYLNNSMRMMTFVGSKYHILKHDGKFTTTKENDRINHCKK